MLLDFFQFRELNINKDSKQVILNQNLTLSNERQLQKMSFGFEQLATT